MAWVWMLFRHSVLRYQRTALGTIHTIWLWSQGLSHKLQWFIQLCLYPDSIFCAYQCAWHILMFICLCWMSKSLTAIGSAFMHQELVPLESSFMRSRMLKTITEFYNMQLHCFKVFQYFISGWYLSHVVQEFSSTIE